LRFASSMSKGVSAVVCVIVNLLLQLRAAFACICGMSSRIPLTNVRPDVLPRLLIEEDGAEEPEILFEFRLPAMCFDHRVFCHVEDTDAKFFKQPIRVVLDDILADLWDVGFANVFDKLPCLDLGLGIRPVS